MTASCYVDEVSEHLLHVPIALPSSMVGLTQSVTFWFVAPSRFTLDLRARKLSNTGLALIATIAGQC